MACNVAAGPTPTEASVANLPLKASTTVAPIPSLQFFALGLAIAVLVGALFSARFLELFHN